MILVTGATGKTGGEAVKHLLAKGASIRAIVRDADKAQNLKQAGVELAVGDIGDSDVLKRAFDGVDRAFLLLPNGKDQLQLENQFTDHAVAAGIKLLVKQSSFESVPGSTKPIPKMHVDSEAHIKASGLNWTMIRPSFFMQMLLTSARTIKENRTIVFPLGQGTVAATDVRDAGEIIAKVLTEDGHENKSYDLTGPELLTFSRIAELFSDALGTQIEYVDQPLNEYKAYLEQFIKDEWRVDAVCQELKALADGCTDHTTDTIKQLLGREPVSMKQFIQDHLSVFQ